MSKPLDIIVAIGHGGVIGVDNKLPWRQSEDLKRFKKLTMGHALVMGRKTFDSIGRPLPGRQNIVISRNADYSAEGIVVCPDLASACAAAESERAFVIGGAQIYSLVLPQAERLYLTHVHCEVEGDAFFPPVDWGEWSLVGRETRDKDEKNQFDVEFLDFRRRTLP